MPAAAELTPAEIEAKAAQALKEAKAVLTKRDDLIAKTYYDKSGYNSLAITLRDVRKKDDTINKKYVENWFDANVLKRGHAQGVNKNSFVAPHKGYEHQINIFFINDLDAPQKYKGGFVMIDMFTRFATVIPVHSRDADQCSLGIIEGIQQMKDGQGVKQPEMIYGDDEGGWSKGVVP